MRTSSLLNQLDIDNLSTRANLRSALLGCFKYLLICILAGIPFGGIVVFLLYQIYKNAGELNVILFGWFLSITVFPFLFCLGGIIGLSWVIISISRELLSPSRQVKIWPKQTLNEHITTFISKNPGFRAQTPLPDSTENNQAFSSILNNDGTKQLQPLLETTGTPFSKGDWYRLGNNEESHLIFRLDLENPVPHILINTHIESGEGFLNSYKNTVNVPLSGDMERFFSILTTDGGQQTALRLLPPDVLWKITVDLDQCDVELHDHYADFIWTDYGINSSILLGRTQSIQAFVKEFEKEVQNFKLDSVNNQVAIELPRRPLYKTPVWKLVGIALVISFIASLMLCIAAWGSSQILSGLPLVLILPILPPVLSIMMEFVLVMSGINTLKQLLAKIAKRKRIRDYTFYYANRV